MSEIDYDELDKEVGRVMADDEVEGGVESEEEMPEEEISREEMPREEPEEEPIEASEVHVQARPARARGRYMDMVHPNSDMRPPSRNYATGKDVEAPKKEVEKTVKEVVEEVVEDGPEFGVIEDVNREMEAEADFVAEPEALKELPEKELYEEPDANNYSLGGKSPFIPDAKVEKRPLGDYVPEDSTRGVQSTKNVYSQRTPVEQSVSDLKPMVIGAPKRKPGWVWALVTLLVIAAGGGLGVLAFMLYSSQ